MMRRYSRPRHLTAGWARPRPPRWMKSSGLTTMPSPPRPVSSSHQSIPAASLAGSVRSTTRNGVGSRSSGSSRQTGQRLHVPDVVLVGVDAPFGGQEMKRGQLQIVQRVDRPAILPVGVDEPADVLLVATVRGGDLFDFVPVVPDQTCRPPAPAPRPLAAARPGRRRRRRRTARSSSCALADHGISSQSRQAQSSPSSTRSPRRSSPPEAGRGTAAPDPDR